MKKKLAIVITNRSSYNRVKTVLRNLPDHIEPHLILGSSVFLYRYGYVIDNIRNDFPHIPFYRTSIAVEGDTTAKMPKSVGLGVIEITTLLEAINPDAVVTVADRFETMATAIAASYMNIPLMHIQGGEVSGTIDNKVRNAITQLADIHFPATIEAKKRILSMQSDATSGRNVFNFGCPSMDLLVRSRRGCPHWPPSHEELSDIVNTHGTGKTLDLSREFCIVMLHPDTVSPIREYQLMEFISFLNSIDTQKVIFWSNIDPGGDSIAKAYRGNHEAGKDGRSRYIRHLGQEDFGKILSMCSCIIGNSSTGIREASFIGTPSISIGDRQNEREGSKCVLRTTLSPTYLREAYLRQSTASYNPSDLFGNGTAGTRIATIIGSELND